MLAIGPAASLHQRVDATWLVHMTIPTALRPVAAIELRQVLFKELLQEHGQQGPGFATQRYVAVAGVDSAAPRHVRHLLGQRVFNFLLVHIRAPVPVAATLARRAGAGLNLATSITTPCFMPSATAQRCVSPRRPWRAPRSRSTTVMRWKPLARAHSLNVIPAVLKSASTCSRVLSGVELFMSKCVNKSYKQEEGDV